MEEQVRVLPALPRPQEDEAKEVTVILVKMM